MVTYTITGAPFQVSHCLLVHCMLGHRRSGHLLAVCCCVAKLSANICQQRTIPRHDSHCFTLQLDVQLKTAKPQHRRLLTPVLSDTATR